MKRVGLTVLVCVLAVGCWFAAGRLHTDLHRLRREHGLAHAEPLENAPPLVVFSTVALGGFSGLIADMLWVRAAQLQMDGQYFELVQLADWITKLQPRFPEGWVYHAWNLAYNISVMFDRPEDRWRWVRHGVELLRDGGLRYNPADPNLHRELGWLFQHKIGSTTDQAHMFYKYAWAQEMDRLLGGRAPDYDALAQAPRSRAALMAVEGMPALLTTLREAGLEPLAYYGPTDDRWEALIAALDADPLGPILLDHIRVRTLIDRYRLIPERMQHVEAEIGPVDWRLPQAHAAYWAWNGLPYAEDFEELALRRMIFQSMADAFLYGRFVYDRAEELFFPAPNPDLLPYVMQAYQEALAQVADPSTVRGAYLNFLNTALTTVYTYHRLADARTVFTELQAQYPDEVAGLSLDQYVVSLFVERMEDLTEMEAQAFVEGFFYQHYFWLALDEPEQAQGYERLARQAWNAYMEPRLQHAEWRERTGLPPLASIREAARREVQAAFTQRATLDRLSP